MFRNYSSIALIGLALAIFFLANPVSADPCCCCGGIVFVGFDYWYPWDYDCYDCCCEIDWWLLPYWEWPPCWRRIIRIYYSPDGWYRYEYYPYYCPGCVYTYVEGRWVYRRAVRLHRRYTYRDMGSDFVRRRGFGTTRYRTTSTSSSTYRTNRTTYRTSSSDDWHREKPTSSSSSYNRSHSTSRYRTSSYTDRTREHNYSTSYSRRSSNRTSSGSHRSGSHSSKSGSRHRTK